MSNDIKIPSVGESITSGVLSTWHKKEGEMVQAGEVLFTLETDKVSSEIVAEFAGVLRITVAEGTEVKIGEKVGTIEEGGGGAAQAKSAGKKKKVAEVLPPKPTGRIETVPEKAVETAENARALAADVTETAPVVEASPPAAKSEESAVSSEHGKGPANETRTERKRMSPLRRKIAAQLVMAQQTAAILTTFNECDMSAVMELRKRVQESFQKQHGVKLGFMSFFIKAAVAALKACPGINGRIEGEDFVQNHFFDIGVAVGTERGLVVPVIRDADRKTFAEIEKDLGDYAVKARDGKIKIEDLQGGVFTISNGGVYGSLLSTPILNPPQSGILGMHKTQERPVAVEGQVVIRPMMYLALSYDHRVVDGKEAVTFLVRLKECIEDPMRLLLSA